MISWGYIVAIKEFDSHIVAIVHRSITNSTLTERPPLFAISLIPQRDEKSDRTITPVILRLFSTELSRDKASFLELRPLFATLHNYLQLMAPGCRLEILS